MVNATRRIVVAIALSFVFGCDSNQVESTSAVVSADPIGELEAIATRARNITKRYPGRNGSWSDWSVYELDFDARKTDSLVKPYQGEIILAFIAQYNYPKDRSKTVLDCQYRLGLVWRNDRWQAEDHQIALLRTATVTDVGTAKEETYGSEPRRKLSPFTDHFSKINFGTDIRARMVDLVGIDE